MSAKPTPPCVRALDADGSEFFMDARGLAWRSDSSRVPELDGPPSGAPLDRAEVVRVLMREHRLWAAGWSMSNSRRNVARQSFCCGAQRAIYELASHLGLRAEFEAACLEVPHA